MHTRHNFRRSAWPDIDLNAVHICMQQRRRWKKNLQRRSDSEKHEPASSSEGILHDDGWYVDVDFDALVW